MVERTVDLSEVITNVTYTDTVADSFAQKTAGFDLDATFTDLGRSRVLVVEDEPDHVLLLKAILRKAGLDVASALDGHEALRKCAEAHPNVILLDLMMPGMDGWEIMRHLRQITDAPVVIVSAKASRQDVVLGLERGADDYVTKPFLPAELAARVQTVLRRAAGSGTAKGRVFPKEQLVIGFETREVKLRDHPIELAPREFDVLEVLAKHAPKPATHQAIAESVWGEDTPQTRVSLKSVVFHLRHKLETNPSHPQLIRTRPGFGYQLCVTA